MHVVLRCPCGANLKAPVSYVGRELKCPKCSTMLVVPPPPTAQASQPSELEVLEPYEFPPQATGAPAGIPLPASPLPQARTRSRQSPVKPKKKTRWPLLVGVGVVLVASFAIAMVVVYKSVDTGPEKVVLTDASGKKVPLSEYKGQKYVPRKEVPLEENHFDSGVRRLVKNTTDEFPELDLQQLIKVVEPSVVRINVVQSTGEEMIGSGFFVDDEGKIFTNSHVIRNAAKVTVETADRKKAESIGFLVDDKDLDLAIIQVDPADFNIVPIAIANDLPAKGEDVVAFGAPQGFSFSQATGVVGSVRSGKEVHDILNEMSPGFNIYSRHGFAITMTWIQHTAAISGGNSGGPLVNMRGQLVGVNTWTHEGGQNLNFASTMKEVRRVFSARQEMLLQYRQMMMQ